ncbi:MAG TPA: T9SS type A sorting domain-containing protein, partial [Flavobacterium sp.]|nr:T9SS type A sorting domain-containing protein [Flavobacterium sp.]
VNGPMETPPVNINDILNFTATINPIAGDDSPADNIFALAQTVVGALDPNEKLCLEGNLISPANIGDYLHYTINFENTGNAPAENIVVKDMIDTAKFDINSLQLMDVSHPVVTRITGNKVEFVFENINLAAAAHGNVTFKIKTKNTLVAGNSVSNKVDIFFDYNFPVTTNTATSVFQLLATGILKKDNSVTIYPNPATDNFTVKANSKIKSIQLFDVQGRIVATYLAGDSQAKTNISQFSKGIYFVKVTTQDGTSIEKIIKK